jgi:hypothetical protein
MGVRGSLGNYSGESDRIAMPVSRTLMGFVAILGLIPIAPTVFWGPMAYAVMGGLAVATLRGLPPRPLRNHEGSNSLPVAASGPLQV